RRAARRRTAQSPERATESAAAYFASFAGLRVKYLPQPVHVVAAREGGKGLRLRPMREVALQHAFDPTRNLLRLHVAIDLAPDGGVVAETAADGQVVTLDLSVALFHLAREQADIPDVMLRARVMAAGQMDVHRRVDSDAPLAPLCDLLRMALRIRRRKS